MRLKLIDDDATVAVVQERALRAGPTMTPGGLDRLVISTIDRLRDPAEVLAAHARARQQRTGIAAGFPQDEGMGCAIVTGSAEEIALILEWARQFTVRNRAKGDTRTVGQRRVEALLAALTGEVAPQALSRTAPVEDVDATPAEDPAGARTSQPTAPETSPSAASGSEVVLRAKAPISLRLVMTLETLMGLDEAPAWLQGHGTLSAALARQLAVQPAAIQRMLLEGVGGQVLDLGRTHRLANQAIADFARARDPVCDGLGCNYGSEHCELDHEEPYAQGGSTSARNTRPRCPHHHHSREIGWEPARGEGGYATWRSASGISYQTMPAPEMDIKLDWDPLDPRPHWPMKRPSSAGAGRASLSDYLRSRMPGADCGPAEDADQSAAASGGADPPF